MVAPALRNAARGRQQQVYEGLHLPGPPVALAGDRYVFGWGCDGQPPCQGPGLFLAVDADSEQLFLLLMHPGRRPEMLAPRGGRWPAPLAAPFAAFAGPPPAVER